jgi:hypothetical protein
LLINVLNILVLANGRNKSLSGTDPLGFPNPYLPLVLHRHFVRAKVRHDAREFGDRRCGQLEAAKLHGKQC